MKIKVSEEPGLHINKIRFIHSYPYGTVYRVQFFCPFFFFFFLKNYYNSSVDRDCFKIISSPALRSQYLSSVARSAMLRHAPSPQINFRSHLRHHLCPISAALGRDRFPSMVCLFPLLSCSFLWRWVSQRVERMPALCKRRSLYCDSVLAKQGAFGVLPCSDGPQAEARTSQRRSRAKTKSCLAARKGEDFVGTFAVNEGKSNMKRNSQVVDITDMSKHTGTANIPDSFYQVIDGFHSLVFLLYS